MAFVIFLIIFFVFFHRTCWATMEYSYTQPILHLHHITMNLSSNLSIFLILLYSTSWVSQQLLFLLALDLKDCQLEYKLLGPTEMITSPSLWQKSWKKHLVGGYLPPLVSDLFLNWAMSQLVCSSIYNLLLTARLNDSKHLVPIHPIFFLHVYSFLNLIF